MRRVSSHVPWATVDFKRATLTLESMKMLIFCIFWVVGASHVAIKGSAMTTKVINARNKLGLNMRNIEKRIKLYREAIPFDQPRDGVSTPRSLDFNSERKRSSIIRGVKTLWKFSRPHTIIGTITSVIALHLCMVPMWASAFTPEFLMVIGHALISSLFINVFIVGLNQLTDIEIDKINKPELPLASGELSKRNGIIVILTALALGLGIGMQTSLTSLPLQGTLIASAVLGTLYSLPPFRLKRFPVTAAFCISAVRGFVINWGFASHALLSFLRISGDPNGPNPGIDTLGNLGSLGIASERVAIIASFYTIYGIVIALAKDVPDVAGDLKFGIRTFSVRKGPDFVLSFAQWLLSITHFIAGGILASQALAANTAQRLIAAFMAILAGVSIRTERRGVDANDPKAAYDYYMHLWKMFYLSYLVLPLAR